MRGVGEQAISMLIDFQYINALNIYHGITISFGNKRKPQHLLNDVNHLFTHSINIKVMTDRQKWNSTPTSQP